MTLLPNFILIMDVMHKNTFHKHIYQWVIQNKYSDKVPFI